MSARTRLLFSEAWSSITANISTTFAATMTVLIGMFLLGLFIALGTWVLSWLDVGDPAYQPYYLAWYSNRTDYPAAKVSTSTDLSTWSYPGELNDYVWDRFPESVSLAVEPSTGKVFAAFERYVWPYSTNVVMRTSTDGKASPLGWA